MKAFIETHIDAIIPIFYERLLASDYLKIFFTDEVNIDALIEKQKQRFLYSLTLEPEALEENYIELGRYHQEIGIPFEIFSVGIELLEELLVAQPLHVDADMKRSIRHFCHKILIYTAKGYMLRAVEDFSEELILLIEGDFSYHSDHETMLLRAHLLWMFKLILAIRSHDPSKAPEPDPTKCTVGTHLHNDIIPNYMESYKEAKYLVKLHNNIHRFGTLIFYFLENEKYDKALHFITRLFEESLSITHLLEIKMQKIKLVGFSKDPLTDAYTRKSMEEMLDHEFDVANLAKKPLCVIMADLDKFKSVNDTYGHQMGDHVLKVFGKVLEECVRESDFVFRYGGEEFLILLTGTRKESAVAIAERIRSELEKLSISHDGDTIKVTVSQGISYFDPVLENHCTKDELISRADQKLYEAKASGRNRYCI